ncbi:helix-turn-helix transcriptional regulator [Heliobacterium chlorum]|uniref:Helix-turn-helix transcriptional regulator n=1 Tax=Heliobacterium chlorum TaxID=2698 RepID=A0ABR7T7D3_HELCL|nr:helix-turn-helix transcriptional regulator [Heliobacterium chlorum]MBC9786693.1 helix-turn-helix transcriptional regulator [Heliobacterium chlorum]
MEHENEIEIEKRTQELRRMAEAGIYLRTLRKKIGLSLSKLSKELNSSVQYLSELERGVKTPSDDFIQRLAEYYQVDVDDLFAKYGKISVEAQRELEAHPHVARLFAEIRRIPNITDDIKQEMYDEVIQVMNKRIREGENDK